jgi:hypothetical protein
MTIKRTDRILRRIKNKRKDSITKVFLEYSDRVASDHVDTYAIEMSENLKDLVLKYFAGGT